MRISSRENLILLIAALAGAALFFCLFPRVAPTAKLHLAINRGEAQEIARGYLQTHGHNVEGFSEKTFLNIENQQESFLQSHRAGAAERALIESHRPVTNWEVVFRHPERNERFHVMVSAAGEVFHFEHVVPANMAGKHCTQDEVTPIITRFLTRQLGIDWSEYEMVDVQTIKREACTDFTFKWEKKTPALGGLKFRLWAKVIGDEVGGWDRHVQIPQEFVAEYSRRQNTSNLFEVAKPILIITIFVISLISFVLRFHARELSLRNALVFSGFALAVILAYFVMVWFPSYELLRNAIIEDNQNFYLFVSYVNLAVIAFSSALAIFLVWATGESVTREIWPEKLKTFDALFGRRFFFPELGSGILKGFALAAIQLGLWYLIIYGLSGRSNLWLVAGTNERIALASLIPLGAPVLIGLYAAVFALPYAPLFTLGFLRRYLKRTVLAVALAILMFDTIFPDTTTIISRWWQAGASILVGVIGYIFYLRYNLLTLAIGTAVSTMLPYAMMFVSQPDGMYQTTGWASFGLLGAVLIYGYVARVRGAALDEQAITPAYVHHIAERERLKMELDIARKAQLRMLPQQIPQLPGLDIAAFSEPAKEVGGDYFDFVMFDGNRLGIVIGDVSGKGMPAALYMTLTKGFLQARADLNASPREILCRMNRNFYQSAERNIFVSLFYCVIDPINRKMVYARAGHNPIIVRHNASQTTKLLQPPGLAVGLESGEVFERIMKQESIEIVPGDTLVFYTDGLTEGMNRGKEEFGEERLLKVIEDTENGSTAHDLLEQIRKAHSTFVGREEQHDDLTCLVVRVSK
ncbi:SpoIIE family protein phosphatase [candidate division KSB1 bacterium]|nr:SpoIIE family protein phosphatase [candidate division KSB1 bacterium]